LAAFESSLELCQPAPTDHFVVITYRSGLSFESDRASDDIQSHGGRLPSREFQHGSQPGSELINMSTGRAGVFAFRSIDQDKLKGIQGH